MEVGKEILRIRKANNLSARRMSSLIGVSADRLRKWESEGYNPRDEDAVRIQEFFGVTLDELSKIDKIEIDLTSKEVPNKIHFAPPGRFPKRTTVGEEIPFYDVDFIGGGDIEFYNGDSTITAAYTMDIPEFSGCTAFRTYGDSMEKLIRSGDILFATKIEDWRSHLEYGQIYGIICDDKRRYLKYIRKAEKEEQYFLLRSENESYDDFLIPKNKIKSIWLIHGWMNKRV